jgi:hypothetical protein
MHTNMLFCLILNILGLLLEVARLLREDGIFSKLAILFIINEMITFGLLLYMLFVSSIVFNIKDCN